MSIFNTSLMRPSSRSDTLLKNSLRPRKRPGPEVIPMHIGDPVLETPSPIKEAMTAALKAGFTRYAQPNGDPELIEAISQEISTEDVDFSTSQITITAGGSPAITSAILGTVDPGDKVIIPEPTYSLYSDAVLLAGGQPIRVDATQNMRLDVQAIEQAAPSAKMIVLCNPVNPTGIVHTREELTEIGRIAERENLWVLSDEAYDHIIYQGTEFTSARDIPEFADRLIYCQTFSKTFAMTGWRLGYVASPSELANNIAAVHRTFSGPVNSAVQRAGLYAITSLANWPIEQLNRYQQLRDLTLEGLAAIPNIEFFPPQGAFYVFLRVRDDRGSGEVIRNALEAGVGLRSGAEFGGTSDDFVRLAFCIPEKKIVKGLELLRPVFQGS